MRESAPRGKRPAIGGPAGGVGRPVVEGGLVEDGVGVLGLDRDLEGVGREGGDGRRRVSFEAVDPMDDVRPDAQGEVIGSRCRVSDEVEQHRGAEERVVAKDGGEEPGERQG